MPLTRIKQTAIGADAITTAKLDDTAGGLALPGTQYVHLPVGTTAQRPSSAANGQLRYNTDFARLEQYAGGLWQAIDSPPSITSLAYSGSLTAADPAGNETITLTGTNFQSGATVTVGGTSATSVSVVSSTSITFVTPAKTAGDYDVIVTNANGLSARLTSGISYNGTPAFSTAAGNVGSIEGGQTMSTITIVAAEPDGGTLAYSVTSGALPSGTALGSANGQITGTPASVNTDTTFTFTVTATDDENQTNTRQFNLVVLRPVRSTFLNRSLMFDDGQNSKLTNTYTGNSAGNRAKFTISFWVRRTKNQTARIIYRRNSTGDNQGGLYFQNDAIQFFNRNSGTSTANMVTVEKFRDTSKFYHIVCNFDSANSTAADRLIIYVDGVRKDLNTTTSVTQNTTCQLFNSGGETAIGYEPNATSYHAGYLSEFHIVNDAVLAPTSFGEFYNGIWVAKAYTGSHGATNTYGTYLNFSDSSNLGLDSSGNSNNYTVSAIQAEDVHKDDPMNVFASAVPSHRLTDDRGNLRIKTNRTGNWDATFGSHGVNSGKWYYELVVGLSNSDNLRVAFGWDSDLHSHATVYNQFGTSADPFSSILQNNYIWGVWSSSFYRKGGTNGTSNQTVAHLDIVQVAADFDNNKIWFGHNNTWIANDGGTDGNPSAGTNETMTMDAVPDNVWAHPVFFLRSDGTTGSNTAFLNFGQDSSFNINLGSGSGAQAADANGFGEFHYAPPTGFLSLCTENIKSQTSTFVNHLSAANNANRHFDAVKYDGTGNAGLNVPFNFEPDMVWIGHLSTNTNRTPYFNDQSGAKSPAESWTNDATQSTEGVHFNNGVTAYSSSGITLGDKNNFNEANREHIAYGWNFGSGSMTANTDGSIQTSVKVNTTAGQGMMTYTGNGASTASIGHGLNKAPEWAIFNNLDDNSTAIGWHHHLNARSPANQFFPLDNLVANDTNNTSVFPSVPTNSVFNLGSNNSVNGSNDKIVAYYWHGVEGYSHFGSYYGNNDDRGPFIYCGFQPAWIWLWTDGNWQSIWDKSRHVNGSTSTTNGYIMWGTDYNPNNNGSTAGDYMDIHSNGFRLPDTNAAFNQINTRQHFYAAFAEKPAHLA